MSNGLKVLSIDIRSNELYGASFSIHNADLTGSVFSVSLNGGIYRLHGGEVLIDEIKAAKEKLNKINEAWKKSGVDL